MVDKKEHSETPVTKLNELLGFDIPGQKVNYEYGKYSFQKKERMHVVGINELQFCRRVLESLNLKDSDDVRFLAEGSSAIVFESGKEVYKLFFRRFDDNEKDRKTLPNEDIFYVKREIENLTLLSEKGLGAKFDADVVSFYPSSEDLKTVVLPMEKIDFINIENLEDIDAFKILKQGMIDFFQLSDFQFADVEFVYDKNKKRIICIDVGGMTEVEELDDEKSNFLSNQENSREGFLLGHFDSLVELFFQSELQDLLKTEDSVDTIIKFAHVPDGKHLSYYSKFKVGENVYTFVYQIKKDFSILDPDNSDLEIIDSWKVLVNENGKERFLKGFSRKDNEDSDNQNERGLDKLFKELSKLLTGIRNSF